MKRLTILLTVLSTALVTPARAQLEEDEAGFPLGPIGGAAYQATDSPLLRVTDVTPGGPGAAAGLQSGDFIYGANGDRLPPMGPVHTDGWRGAVSELGYAVERSESTGGALTLQILRPSAGNMTLNVTLPAKTAWSTSYPAGDPRMSAYFDKVCADLHAQITASANGDFGYETGFFCIILLAHADWNATSGARPYRLSINKLRDHCVAHLNALILAPAESNLDCDPLGIGLENWKIMTCAMFIGEYRRKSGDAAVNAAVQRAAEMVANRIQDYGQFDNAGVFHADKLGRMGHCGMVGDYPHAGLIPLNIINAHAKIALGMLKGAGANFGVLSGTNGRTIDGKFLLSWDWLKSSTYTSGGSAEGNVGYGGTQSSDYDSAARTAGSAAGYEIYRAAGGTPPTADDLDKLARMKAWHSRHWPRHQHAHAYTTGGTVFAQMLQPFQSVRDQRYFHENSRFLHTLTRDHTGAVIYFPGRALGAGDNQDRDRYLRAGMAWAVASGNLPSFPAGASNRVFVRMNAPRNDWPQLAARRARVVGLVQGLDLDVTSHLGTVLTSGITAAWSKISGPAMSFSATNTLDTTATFSAAGTYRLRHSTTVGSYTAVEDYDFEVATSVTPPDTSATITLHPVSRTGVPGGTATFTTAVTGGGPFVYQWTLNGVSYWGGSASSTLTLSNLSANAAGNYRCVITHPGGQVTTNPATLTLAGTTTLTNGCLKREVWNALSGIAVTDLTGSSRYPLFPDSTGTVTSAETPQDYGSDYGQRLSGWVIAPSSGTYKFYLSSDDASELWLSTDATTAGKVKIAQITGWNNFRTWTGISGDISLTAGQRYYIEALHKEGSGGDHLSVAWQKPGDAVPATGAAPIPGANLQYEQFTPDPALNGLVSRWAMDEGSGTIARDSLATGNDGTLSGPSWTTGRRLGGLLFDSTDQIFCANAGALGGLTPFTLTAWVNVNSGNASELVILQQRAANGFNGQYVFKVTAAGKVGLWVYGNNATQFDLAGTTSINDGQWHHIAAGRDGAGGGFIYVDGVLNGSTSATTVRNLNANINVGIGADIRDNNRHFRGSMDEVRIYSRLLSAAEIAAVRNAAPQFTADPIAGAGAAEGTAYAGTLAGSATDPDAGETLTYSRVSGPAWLSVAANGSLTGTPALVNIGANAFTVRVTDSFGATDDAVLNITVANGNGAPCWFTDFNTLPAGVSLYGHAALAGGEMRLTDALSNQQGTIVVANLTGAQAVSAFDVTYDVWCGGGTAPPADGFSFAWGAVPAASFGEEGPAAFSGLVVSFDIFQNDVTELAREATVKWNGTQIARTAFDAHTSSWAPVHIRLRPGGRLDVRHGGQTVFDAVPLPGFTAQTGPLWAFGARTGGLNAMQKVDNLRINAWPHTVTNGNDSGAGSLRAALTAASAAACPGPSQIHFTSGMAGQSVTLAAELSVNDPDGVLVDATGVSGGVTINGGPGTNRIFYQAAGSSLELASLTLTGGNGVGAGINNYGGAIFSQGTLRLLDCSIAGNTATVGGAIAFIGGTSVTTTLRNSTLSGNTAGHGGAIQCEGTLRALSCTFAGNTATVEGGAVSAPFARPVFLRHCTVSGNSATGTGGGLLGTGLHIQNSIVAGNTATTNANLTPGFTATAANLTSGNPLLAPLHNYGGSTRTLALLPGSPARNAATAEPAGTEPLTADQRYFPLQGAADLGAYEAGTFTNYNAYIWETLPTAGNGTTTDPLHATTFDFDGDGQTNGDEFIFLTSAASAASYFALTANISGANLVISFRTATGRTYRFERNDTLVPAWVTTGLPAITGDGNVKSFSVPAGSPPSRFFRVVVN